MKGFCRISEFISLCLVFFIVIYFGGLFEVFDVVMVNVVVRLDGFLEFGVNDYIRIIGGRIIREKYYFGICVGESSLFFISFVFMVLRVKFILSKEMVMFKVIFVYFKGFLFCFMG